MKQKPPMFSMFSYVNPPPLYAGLTALTEYVCRLQCLYFCSIYHTYHLLYPGGKRPGWMDGCIDGRMTGWMGWHLTFILILLSSGTCHIVVCWYFTFAQTETKQITHVSLLADTFSLFPALLPCAQVNADTMTHIFKMTHLPHKAKVSFFSRKKKKKPLGNNSSDWIFWSVATVPKFRFPCIIAAVAKPKTRQLMTVDQSVL